VIEDFVAEVLEIEHRIISGHKSLADIVIRKDFLDLDDFSEKAKNERRVEQ